VDFQTFLNMFGGAALAVTGWFARQLWGAVDDLRQDLSKLREELPKTYITKDDFKDGVRELKDLLIAIDTKLDRKVDK
jgi:cell division protein FtsB